MSGCEITQQGPNADAGCAFWPDRARFFLARGTRDVEVGPGQSFAEVLQKERRRDRAAGAASGVLDVGDVAFDLALQLVDEGHAPHPLAGALRGIEEPIGKGVVGGEEGGRAVAERDDRRSGQGCQVDELRRATAGGIDKPVGENESALGVGGENLHRDAVHPSDHVAGPKGRPGNHVFGGADGRLHWRRATEITQCGHGAEHSGSAGHVAFHLQHALIRFDRVATGVERDRLADQSDDSGSGCIVGRLIAQPDETRRVDAAAANRERGGGADCGQLRRTQHLDLEIGLLGHGLGAVGKLLRSQRRGRFVAQVAGQVDAPRHSGSPVSALVRSPAVDISCTDELHRFNIATVCRLGGRLSSVVIEAIKCQRNPDRGRLQCSREDLSRSRHQGARRRCGERRHLDRREPRRPPFA